MYDPAIGKFPSVDPISDKFAFVSPFNYAENEPIAHIDLWGLQKTLPDGRQGHFSDGYEDKQLASEDIAFSVTHDEVTVTPQSNTSSLPKSSHSNITGFVAKVWNSDYMRNRIPDAFLGGIELNTYVFGGVSEKPIGGLFIVRGPEAFTFHTFSDVGVGGGIEASGAFFFEMARVIGSPGQIKSKYFGGLRTSFSIDVSSGPVGGLNFGFNNPTGNSPLIYTLGMSLGVGATSPFGIGGNINEGYTHIYK